MWTPSVLGLPPPALMPPPVRPFQPVPIDLDEVRKLCDVECSDLAPEPDGVSSRLGAAALWQLSNELDAPLKAPTLATASPSYVGKPIVSVIERELNLLVHVDLVPPKQLRGRIASPEGAVLARWQCSEDELDLFAGCVAHAVFGLVAQLKLNPDPRVE